jgi:hypothetical protein
MRSAVAILTAYSQDIVKALHNLPLQRKKERMEMKERNKS